MIAKIRSWSYGKNSYSAWRFTLWSSKGVLAKASETKVVGVIFQSFITKSPALIWQKYLIRGRAVLSGYVATTRAGDVLPHLKIDIIDIFLCQCWIGSIWNFIIGVTNIFFANIELDQCETPAPICITNILLLGNDPTCCLEHWVCQAPKTQMLPIFSSTKFFKITWRKAGAHCHNLHRFLTTKLLSNCFKK